ncbi:glycosyltransferase [Acidothermaceae bacterium B102]|nr:glycosyltransferase [Acidothermaceae bacterium B102]
MSHPRVAVVMPALNRETMILRALASISSQTRVPDEIIVVDDASTDRTAAVAREAGATVVVMPERSGSGPARNAGILATSAKWVAFLDSDDEWEPRHLELLLRQAGSANLVTAPALDSSGRLRGNPSRRLLPLTPKMLLVPGDAVVTSGTMVRRDALVAAGMFRALPRAQDLDLWLRVLESGPGVASGVPTVKYHEHATQASKDNDLMRQAFISILDEYSDRRWLTPGVRLRSHTLHMWDSFRAAQSGHQWPEAVKQGSWFVRHPSTVPALAQLLLRRRQSRAF